MTMETNRLRGLIRYVIKESYGDPEEETARVDRDRALGKKRVFTYHDADKNSHKFWWIRANLTGDGIPDGTVTTGWGRVGAMTQTQTKVAPRGQVQKFMTQIIDSKLRKGYKERFSAYLGEAFGLHDVNNEDFNAYRQAVDDELLDIWPESGGLEGCNVRDEPLKVRFRRGDDARTTALSIKDAEDEGDPGPRGAAARHRRSWTASPRRHNETFVPRGPMLFLEKRNDKRTNDPEVLDYGCNDCDVVFSEDDIEHGKHGDVCPECGGFDISPNDEGPNDDEDDRFW